MSSKVLIAATIPRSLDNAGRLEDAIYKLSMWDKIVNVVFADDIRWGRTNIEVEYEPGITADDIMAYFTSELPPCILKFIEKEDEQMDKVRFEEWAVSKLEDEDQPCTPVNTVRMQFDTSDAGISLTITACRDNGQKSWTFSMPTHAVGTSYPIPRPMVKNFVEFVENNLKEDKRS